MTSELKCVCSPWACEEINCAFCADMSSMCRGGKNPEASPPLRCQICGAALDVLGGCMAVQLHATNAQQAPTASCGCACHHRLNEWCFNCRAAHSKPTEPIVEIDPDTRTITTHPAAPSGMGMGKSYLPDSQERALAGWNQSTSTPEPAAILLCGFCQKPATCVGAYEGTTNPGPACDECCGHGNEDGWCHPISNVALWLPRLQTALATVSASEREELRDLREGVRLSYEAVQSEELKGIGVYRRIAGREMDRRDKAEEALFQLQEAMKELTAQLKNAQKATAQIRVEAGDHIRRADEAEAKLEEAEREHKVTSDTLWNHAMPIILKEKPAEYRKLIENHDARMKGTTK